MTVQRSVTVRNARLDATQTAIGASPRLQLRTGPQPADYTAPDAGALLAEFILPTVDAAPAANGQKAFNAVTPVTALASGTIGHYRIKNNAGSATHEQGSVGVQSASPDLVCDNPVLLAGQQVTVTGWVLTEPGA